MDYDYNKIQYPEELLVKNNEGFPNLIKKPSSPTQCYYDDSGNTLFNRHMTLKEIAGEFGWTPYHTKKRLKTALSDRTECTMYNERTALRIFQRFQKEEDQRLKDGLDEASQKEKKRLERLKKQQLRNTINSLLTTTHDISFLEDIINFINNNNNHHHKEFENA